MSALVRSAALLARALMCWVLMTLGGGVTTALADTPTSHTLREAMFHSGPCTQRYVSERVLLPDDWRTRNVQTPGSGCYRFSVTLSEAPQVPWSLQFHRLPGNHRITVNGQTLRTHFMDSPQINSLSMLPHLMEVPAQVLRAGRNQVDVEVRMGPFRKPGISEAILAPLSTQQLPFEREHLLTVELPMMVNLCVAGIALFVLLAWRARPGETHYAYFGGLMVCMGLRNASFYVETAHLPIPVLDWLFFTIHASATYFLIGFGLSYARIDVNRFVWPMRAIGLGLPLAALTTIGTGQLHMLRLVAFPLMLICGVLALFQVVKYARKRSGIEAWTMTLGPVVALGSSFHDFLTLTPLLSVNEPYWTPFTTPVIFVAYALTLMSVFVNNMNAAEQANASLEQRVQERTLALESANQSKTRFLAAASHDLRQPTAAIGLLVSLLRQQPGIQTEARHLVTMLDEAVTSMESLLVGLLDISRLDAGAVTPQFQPVSVHELFQAVRVHEQSAAELKGLSLRFRVPRHIGNAMVTTDPMLVHSVLRNLVSNAIRYTPKGGVLVAARRRGRRRLRIEVWDTGIGIPPDQHERIFEEFYQVDNASRDRTRGIGLGLAIVRRTAGLLGEHIKVTSRPGRGSVFRFELPLHQATIEKAPSTLPPPQPLLGARLWLVEDDALLRRAMTELLQRWGAQVRAWGDAESLQGDMALRAGSASVDERPHILITDYRLPGLNGLQLSQSVSTQWHMIGHTLQTLVVSGDTDPTEIGRLNASGLSVLSKPFRSERLLERLLQLLSNQGSSEPAGH